MPLILGTRSIFEKNGRDPFLKIVERVPKALLEYGVLGIETHGHCELSDVY